MQDLYGYAIVKELHPIFPTIQESAIYVILRRLHQTGILDSYNGTTSSGPPRKYYRMTAKGKNQYCKLHSEVKELFNSFKKIGLL